MIMFVITMIFLGGMLWWQIDATAPGYWCKLAADTTPENSTGCFQVLLKLVDVKDNTITGLMVILGLAVAGLISVALGLNIKASGPGGTSVDINERETKIDTDETSVTIPTPPSEDK